MNSKQPGYYPGFQTLRQQKFWDARTREVVLERVNRTHHLRFFSPAEAKLLKAVADHVIPQDDRDPSRRIEIVAVVDERLAANRTPGYRYEDMPQDPDSYRLALEGIDLMSIEQFGCSFLDLNMRQQDELLRSLHKAEPIGAAEIWHRVPVHRFWAMLMSDCVEAYYSHPWAWDEIGFGGPAYPRAYTRLENGDPEPWEVEEQRYEWTAPEWAVSDRFEPAGGSENPPHGQEGTH